MPDEPSRAEGKVVGLDIGVNKLITLSDGQQPKFLGITFKEVRDKIKRRTPGSKRRKRSLTERDNLINQTLNQLPWSTFRAIGVEKLHDMKRGNQKDRGKTFRKAMAPWTYRQVLNRIQAKAQENRVLLVAVPPANTSRECPRQFCGKVSEDNRKGEEFRCICCGYTADADFVGATNVLVRTLSVLGSVESPRPQKVMI